MNSELSERTLGNVESKRYQIHFTVSLQNQTKSNTTKGEMSNQSFKASNALGSLLQLQQENLGTYNTLYWLPSVASH